MNKLQLEPCFLSWRQVEQASTILIDKVRQFILEHKLRTGGCPFDCVVAILEGGTWLGIHVSKELNIPLEFIHVSKNNNIYPEHIRDKYIDKRVLLVDDIYDTGETIAWIKNNMLFKELQIACLYSKEISINNIISAGYCDPSIYVIFPWEKESFGFKDLVQTIKFNILKKLVNPNRKRKLI